MPTLQSPMADTLPLLPQKQSSSICIIFQNVHGLPKHNHHPKNNSLCCFLTEHQVDVMGMSEVKVAWHQVHFHESGSCTSKWFESHHVMRAWNQHESFHSTAQTGGIAVLTIDKLMYQVALTGCDPTGLGCWTWTHFLGKHAHYTHVITCYDPVKNDKGLSLSIISIIDILSSIKLISALFNNTWLTHRVLLNNGKMTMTFWLWAVIGMRKCPPPPGKLFGITLALSPWMVWLNIFPLQCTIAAASNWIWFTFPHPFTKWLVVTWIAMIISLALIILHCGSMFQLLFCTYKSPLT